MILFYPPTSLKGKWYCHIADKKIKVERIIGRVTGPGSHIQKEARRKWDGGHRDSNQCLSVSRAIRKIKVLLDKIKHRSSTTQTAGETFIMMHFYYTWPFSFCSQRLASRRLLVNTAAATTVLNKIQGYSSTFNNDSSVDRNLPLSYSTQNLDVKIRFPESKRNKQWD